jgi:hypothetical protein
MNSYHSDQWDHPSTSSGWKEQSKDTRESTYAPAFAAARKRQETDTPRSTYAPAFATVRKGQEKDTYRNGGDTPSFSYLRKNAQVSDAGWSTHDSNASRPNWSDEIENDNTVDIRNDPWNWTAKNDSTYTVADGTAIAPEVHEQFIGEQDVMKPGFQHKSAFEKRNVHLLGGSGAAQIVSMIGDQATLLTRKVDDRVTHMDRHGNYVDGINRGKPKKRHLEEHSQRIAERDGELKRANYIWNEWNSLTSEQQAERRAQAAENRRIMAETLVVEDVEVDEIPNIYNRSIADINAAVRKWRSAQSRPGERDSGMPDIYSRPLEALRSEVDSFRSASLDHDQSDAQSDLIFLQEEDTSVDLMQFSDKSAETRQTPTSEQGQKNRLPPHTNKSNSPWARSRGRRRGRGRGPNYETPPSLTRSDAFYISEASQERDSTPSKSHTKSAPTLYRFQSHPPLMPTEDVPGLLVDLSKVANEDVCALQADCEKHPRVVSIALTDENVKYTSAAMISRIFGGAIQEIQFCPSQKQAVAVFVTSKDAEILIQHVDAASKASAHEYRRLQVAAEWYQGHPSKAVLSVDGGLLEQVIKQHASRTLLVGKIHQHISKDILLASLQAQFEDNHIVRVKVLRPSKKYELEEKECNSIEVEFTSIPQALEAKLRMEVNRVRGFEDKPVTFIQDTTNTLPARQPWCNCRACTQDPAESSNNRNRPFVDANQGIGFIMMQREQRREGTNYEPETDLLIPDSLAYEHEDVKRPRLNNYDVPGMRRFADREGLERRGAFRATKRGG